MLDLLQPLLNLIQTHPFLFIFVGMLVAGEAVLLPAIFLATTGQLDLSAVISLAVLAMLLSDLAWYGLGRALPATALEWIPGRPSKQLAASLNRMYTRRGAQILFFSKFAYGTRTIAQVLAGLHDMPFRTYIFFNLLGVLALSGSLVAVAYLVVGNHSRLGAVAHNLELTFLLFISIAVCANLLTSKLLRHRWSRA